MLSRDYIAGFIDGEGYFRIGAYAIEGKKGKSNGGVCFFMQIDQRDDNAKILFEIQETMGCGVIFKQSRQYKRDKGEKQQDMYRYNCASRKDLQIFFEFFGDGNMFFVKKEEYQLFKKAFEWYINKHRPRARIIKEVRDKMIEFKEELQRLKKYNSDKIPKIDVSVLTTLQTKLD